MSKIQNSDVKSESDLIAGGATKSSLINDTKIYITASGLNKRLDEAIVAGDLGAGSVPDATTSVKGKIKLAGDLDGTADLPTIVVPCVSALSSSGQSIPAVGTVMVFEIENLDNYSGYNPATGVFTVPSGKAGIYIIHTTVSTANFTPSSGANSVVCSIQVNGVTVKQGVTRTGGTSLASYQSQTTAIRQLSVGDQVRVIASSTTATTMNTTASQNELFIAKVSS